ncbi:MAG: type II secretion system protein [Propionivibrio sp.]
MIERQRNGTGGFTIVEMLVTIVIVGILASAVVPLVELSVQRNKEQDLRVALREIRTAIDTYRQAVDEGRIEKLAGESGYPRHLEDLVAGIPDAKNPKGGKLYFLRRIPMDPMRRDSDGSVAGARWGLRSYASSPEEPKEGEDVFDVYSLSVAIGMNGIPYREW